MFKLKEFENMLARASAHCKEGKAAESRRLLMRALHGIDKTIGRDSVSAVLPLLRVAAGFHSLQPDGRNELSFELELQAHRVAMSRLHESDSRVMRSLSQLGCTLSARGRYEEAADMLAHCVRLSGTYGNPKALAYHMVDLAVVLMVLTRYADAASLLERARMTTAEDKSALHRAGTILLGGALVKLGRFGEGLELLEPLQRHRIERYGRAPQDEMTQWYEEALRGVSPTIRTRPKPRKKPRKTD
jgi:tetratricopeptide (TPR) repeat protein